MAQQRERWLVTVVRSLQDTKGKWRLISEATSIPYDTLTKIALGRVTDPRVSNVQALFDYFASPPDDPATLDCAQEATQVRPPKPSARPATLDCVALPHESAEAGGAVRLRSRDAVTVS